MLTYEIIQRKLEGVFKLIGYNVKVNDPRNHEYDLNQGELNIALLKYFQTGRRLEIHLNFGEGKLESILKSIIPRLNGHFKPVIINPDKNTHHLSKSELQ